MLALAACGGSDDPEPAQPSPTDAPSSDGADAQTDADADAGGSGDAGAATSDGGEVVDQLDDAMGGGLDEALDAMPTEGLWGIVADQLGDDVEVEIAGADIRLTLNEGSTDDAIGHCLISGSFVEEGQVVTLVYPDGEVNCDE